MSQIRMAQMSALGTGLLLGAAMGVIIPEGVEAIYDSMPNAHAHGSESKSATHSDSYASNPSFIIACSLLVGFTVMFSMEQMVTPALSSRSSHANKYELAPTTAGSPTSEFELGGAHAASQTKEGSGKDPRMLTLGLVIHSFADGMALGAANALDRSSQAVEAGENPIDSGGLSLVVFIAIAVHKAPTALALTTTLLTQLPVRQIKQHLLAFCLASPLAAILTYLFLAFVGGSEHLQGYTGIALMFSGGTFLYVATVLSSLPAHSHGESSPLDHTPSAELGNKTRTLLVIVGMFIPLSLSGFVGHGH
ncbi:hypothetical protein FRB96_003622 [Tulasnella sp. 330]|nr:hypothetical protein FRB96_003622 [Tulasnella sp. 330]KAG8880838.1 hypothetical protein FRB98_004714 [Tulasnella sp. 332]